MPFRPTAPALERALAARNYAEPTPVQDAVLEPHTEGRDLLVSAQTGSGKTVAYGLAIAKTLLGDAERFEEAGAPLALVVAPTRELALQVHREFEWLYGETGAKIVTCVGGMDPRAEQKKLQAGAHIVVGTPGRLRDHLERGRLQIGGLRAVILDEADEMLDLGFREDLEFMLEATPESRRTLLFSATLPKAINAMAKRYQRDALRIEATRGATGHVDIEYRAIRIAPNEVEHAVVNMIRFTEAPSAIVFCNTREAVRHLHSGLVERGFSAVSLSGELGQSERNAAMQSLRDGRARVCVATDVAARGIDLPSLGLVIHAELPNDAETLQHRSGRTGRAGRKGVSVLLVPISRRKKAERLLAEARITPTWGGAPTADDIRKLDEERLLSDPILTQENGEEDMAVAKALLERHSAEDLAAALARVWRSHLPAPEDVYDPGFGRDPKPAKDYAEGHERGTRKERDTARGGPTGATTWFHMDIGRRNNADPKWLLPLICRRGKVTRSEIGAIRIFDRETKFEISEEAAKRFLASAEGTDGDDITITLAPESSGGEFAAAPAGKPRPRKPFVKRDGPAGGAPRPAGGDKAYAKPRRPKKPQA
ncbi:MULTISPECIES: DEAD/DEAH box helicase [unclassified Aureimonas]|uniref:DEAD/DEAH box helicase n=1 Tax=unclassified Aureimonas TaxID=2615206 RepID=UPI0006FDF6DF|nr:MULTISPECIES: DEAD/DEAH box helicase [unclassified Aureimonas]KQT60652.1 helicase [Aureimonas sp. Leaf460]KQT68781.1 helicase [Aureimonas sp. Leaf427]